MLPYGGFTLGVGDGEGHHLRNYALYEAVRHVSMVVHLRIDFECLLVAKHLLFLASTDGLDCTTIRGRGGNYSALPAAIRVHHNEFCRDCLFDHFNIFQTKGDSMALGRKDPTLMWLPECFCIQRIKYHRANLGSCKASSPDSTAQGTGDQQINPGIR